MSASQASAGVTLTVCNGGTHACHEANGSPALTIVVAPRDNSASAPVTEVSTSAWQAGDWHHDDRFHRSAATSITIRRHGELRLLVPRTSR